MQRECDLQALTKNESGTGREGGGGGSSSTVLPPWSATVRMDWQDRNVRKKGVTVWMGKKCGCVDGEEDCGKDTRMWEGCRSLGAKVG